MIVVLEANFDVKFEISNLNYPGLYVYIAILVASEAMAASKWPLRSHLRLPHQKGGKRDH